MATFRPQRRTTRMSLSAVPTSTSFPGSLSSAVDENMDQTGRKKRSKSLGGEALTELAALKKDHQGVLSPRKKARRSLVPGRSILKARPAQGDDTTELFTATYHTGTLLAAPTAPTEELTTGGEKDMTLATMYGVMAEEAQAQQEEEEEEEEEDDDDMSMDLTDAVGGIKARKSLLLASASRRVSFAPKAHVRVFTASHDAEGNPVSSPVSDSPSRALGAAALASPTPGSMSPDSANPVGASIHEESPFRSSSRANERAAHLAWLRANPAQAADLEEEEASLSMEMAGDDVTSAFRIRNSIGGVVPGQEDGDGSMAMSEAGDEVTRAFGQNTHVLRGMASLGGTTGLGALGFGTGKGAVSRPSLVISPAAGEEEEDASGETEEGGEGDMDLTLQHDRSVTANAGAGVIFDGTTSRRMSTSGFARRASVAPASGLATTAVDEEDSDDVDMEDATGALDQSQIPLPTPALDSTADLDAFLARPMTPSRFTSPSRPVVDRFGTPPPAVGSPPPSQRRRSASPSKRGVYMPSPRRIDLSPGSIVPFVLPSPRRVSIPKLPLPTIGSSSSLLSPARMKVEHAAVSSSGFPAPSSLARPRPDVVERRLLGLPSPKKSPSKTSPSSNRMVRMAEDDESDMESFQSSTINRVPASMTVDSFLGATNIQFMEDVFGATKRKSMANLHRDEDETAEVRKPTLAAHVHAAAARVPLLELLHTASQELKFGLQENQTCLDEMDADAKQNPPAVFAEWFNATDDEKAVMSAQFAMLKTHYTLAVRNEWYDYKTAMMLNLRKGMDDSLTALQKDLETLSVTKDSLEDALPGLKAKHAQLLVEVGRERNRKAELEACDPEHLKTLKEAIKEQGEVLAEFQGESQEVQNHIARLRAKLEEASAQKEENAASIATGRATCEELRCFTKAEVFRLRDELNGLQHLNGWEIVRFVGRSVDLVFCNELTVGLELVPKGVGSVTLGLLAVDSKARSAHDDVRRVITDFLFARMQAEFAQDVDGQAKDVLRRVARTWTLSRRLRHEVLLARLRFPLSLSPPTKADGNLRATVRIYASAVRAAFDIVFEISGEEIVEGSVENVTDGIGANIKPAFGDIDAEELAYVVRDRIARGGRGALLDACSEAQTSANGRTLP